MKKLDIKWDNSIKDATGYLFSFAKSLGTVVKNSPYSDYAEDIIATSGFAFRMWVADKDLCPSATSIWDFDSQKAWVENGGLCCNYVGRYWGQDDIEEERRNNAINIIKKSIDDEIPAISWDISMPEWGLITGYDDTSRMFSTLSISGSTDDMSYDILGKREIPILSVLTITGKTDKPKNKILKDTLNLAIGHLKGQEWCDNSKGLDAYPALIKFFKDSFQPDLSWNMEYYLGTYGALKYHAYRYFEENDLIELSNLYKEVYENWKTAFEIKTCNDISDKQAREKIAFELNHAYDNERKAVDVMKNVVSKL